MRISFEPHIFLQMKRQNQNSSIPILINPETRPKREQSKKKNLKRPNKSKSQHFENVLSSTGSEGTAFLQIQDLHNSIFSQKRVPSGPHAQPHRLIAQIELSPNGPGEIPISIRQQQHLVPDFEALLPGLDHKGVVDRNAGNGVDPLGLELGGLLHEPGDVLQRACGGEGAGDGEEDGLLGLGELGESDGLNVARGVEV
ncbi:pentatricopeptide repeat-containing protein [Prunus dulcis]|uniref:Pentatricopeptide repeat-containing protein n=1 Tax=Prunus dulcis TaxID=3755 RepID=A0A4Y1RUU6_PRUDU|nr:pentatricopeptide repeat-containing protein [Prunus dulcis]